MKRALITGISGMVGSHLADYLLAKTDWQIYGMARWRSPLDNLSQLTGEINKGQRVHLLYGDLEDEISLRHVVTKSKPDYVFHLAAQSFPQTSFTAPLQTLDVNILGTYRLLNSIQEIVPNAIVHVCSSSEVFGRVPKEFVPIKEDTPFHPASPYAISKVGTDLIGRYFAEAFGLKTITTRMFTHTGPRRGDVFAESSFAKQIAMIEKGLMPSIIKVGNLDSMRTFADVRDAVIAYHLAVTSDLPAGSVFNIGGTHSCTVGEMLQRLLELSSTKNIAIESDPARMRPIDADLQIPDTSSFRSATGWSPKISFDETMQSLLDYWRNRVSVSATIQR
jgi:GDP-4-dehydro-6-deoxy-D-mannose reductase